MEITYNREAAKYIIKDYIKDWVEFRDDGLYIKDDYIDHDWTTQGVFQWSPACELPEHDALTAPVLPIPFSANQLAAFFLTANGAFVASYYGSFEDGPDEGMLLAMGVRANQPREALKAAFAAFRAAQEVVGTLDKELQARAAELGHQYEVANIEANKREAVMEHGISDEEYRERRERARASVAQLHDEVDDLKRRAEEEHIAWRRRMVHRLLDVGMDGTAATQAEAPVGGVSGGSNWIATAQARAVAIIERQRQRDLYPSQEHIADEIAAEFRKAGIVGADGKPLAGAYIKRHALRGISSAQGKQLSTATPRGK